MSRPPIYGGWWQVLTTIISDWQQDKAAFLAAALAYYTLFSVAPLLLIVVAVAGQIFGEQAVTGQLYSELEGTLGVGSAKIIQEMIVRAQGPETGIVASVFGLVTLVLGATGVFAQLKDALNTIWAVQPPSTSSWLITIKSRLLSFAMVLCIGLLLLVSLIINTALSAAQAWMGGLALGPYGLIHLVNTLVSLSVAVVLFALIFKFLPDVYVAWNHVWLGAFATGLLFTIGKYFFALYLGSGAIGSTYGAAASVVVVLLWAYYASLILLLGAEFTQAHARRRSPVKLLARKTCDRASWTWQG